MKAEDFQRVVLFMANRWDRETATEIWGKVMGEHFWSKWVGVCERTKYPDLATMRLFYDMSPNYLQKLIDYVEANYKG